MKLLPPSGGAVHDRSNRSVPTTGTSRTSGQSNKQAGDMEVSGRHLPQVDDASEGDGEGQGVGVNLGVPMKTQRDSQP